MGFALIALLILLAAAWGFRYWAYRAETDRSAFVGLYLLFGIPGILLIVAGAAVSAYGKSLGYVLLPLGVGLVLPLIPGFRRLIARITPVDPTSATDMAGLCVVLGLVCAFGALTVIGPDPDSAEGSVDNAELVLQVVAEIALALVAVGLGINRTFRGTISRLGLIRPTLRIVGVAILFLFLCYFVSGFASVLTTLTQPEISDEINRGLREMTSDVQNPLGAVILGLSAGIGEELLFRGALQPRFGIVLTAMFFALLHTQYGLSFILLGIFALGIVLGIERKRYGTTASIITHAIFNFIAVLALSAS